MNDNISANTGGSYPATDRLVGRTLASDVRHRLRADIVACVLRPGERLRFETMRGVYGVSFSTLREALAHLVQEGLVVAEGQRGFRVAPISGADLDDLVNVRLLIEREVVRLSLQNGDAEWRTRVLAAFHRLDRARVVGGERYHVTPEWLAQHHAFHDAVASACGSRILLELRALLFQRAQRYRRIALAGQPAAPEEADIHRALMEAAITRDSDLTMALVEQHIRDTARLIRLHATEMPAST